MLNTETNARLKIKKFLFQWPEHILSTEYFPVGSNIRFAGYIMLWGLASLILAATLLVLSYQIGTILIRSLYPAEFSLSPHARPNYFVCTILGLGLLVVVSISVLSLFMARICFYDLYNRWFKEQKEQSQVKADGLYVLFLLLILSGIMGTAIPFYFIGAFNIQTLTMHMCGDEDEPRLSCYLSTIALGIGEITFLALFLTIAFTIHTCYKRIKGSPNSAFVMVSVVMKDSVVGMVQLLVILAIIVFLLIGFYLAGESFDNNMGLELCAHHEEVGWRCTMTKMAVGMGLVALATMAVCALFFIALYVRRLMNNEQARKVEYVVQYDASHVNEDELETDRTTLDQE